MSLKPAMGQAGGNEPSLSGQRWSSPQAVVHPAIVDMEELAGEFEVSEVQGESQLQCRRTTNQALQLQA